MILLNFFPVVTLVVMVVVAIKDPYAAPVTSVRHPNLQNKDANLRTIHVSDSPLTIKRGLITNNIYNLDSDAYKDVREYEISEGTFIGPS